MCNHVLRKRLIVWSFSLLFAIMMLPASNMAAATNHPPQVNKFDSDYWEAAKYVPHQLVVRMTSTTQAASLSLPAEVLSVQSSLEHAPVYLLTLDSAASEENLSARLSQWASVVWAHPNYVMNSLHPIQGSYPFPDQDLVGNFENQYAALMLNLAAAHSTATGAGVTVGVIDAGVSFGNPALNGKAVSGFDFVDNGADASDVPGGIATGHGTFVAGVIHLTAPGAVLRSYRVIDPNGAGDGFTLARAIETAVDDGCQVINLSLALTEQHLAVRDAIDYAASHGVTVIAGAGNDGKNQVVYPAAEDNAIAIAAVDSTERASTYTNFGAQVDVCAPGDRIYSAYLNPAFAWWSGTSFSAAFTSGLAALLKENHPGAYGVQIRGMIVSGATNIDSLNPQRSGGLGAGLINPVASLTGGVISDTALVFPSSMQFSYYVCSQGPAPLQQSCIVVATNGPAAYSTAIIPDSGVTFASVDAASGMTGDSVRITADPAGLVPGIYNNTVRFYVVGVENPVDLPVQLRVIACSDSTNGAQVNPPEMWFTASTGSNTVYYGSSTLTSTNAPAPFHASIETVPAIFVRLIDSIGVTNDSVRFQVNPAWLFSAGQYINTIDYFVDGMSEPAKLIVHLDVSDSIPSGNNAWVIPTLQTFTAPLHSSLTMWGSIMVGAEGSPKPFYVVIRGAAHFLVMADSSGMTNDSATFRVVVTPSLNPGVYSDTMVAHVPGATNSQVVSVVHLFIDSTSGGGTDTALVIPARQSFSAPGGVPTQGSGSFVVYASGSSKAFSVNYLNSPHFTELMNFSGLTNDSVKFNIVPTNTAPGVYFDSLVVAVSGVSNSPLLVVNSLVIDTAHSDTTSNSAAVTPNPLIVNAVAGGSIITRQALVTSSNAPAWYVAYVLAGSLTFVTIPDTLGMTNDSLTIELNTSGLEPGTYIDTVMIHVYGVSTALKLTVELRLTAPSPELTLGNYPNPFNPSTKIEFTLPAPAQVHLDVYNVLGQKVVTLIDMPLSAGKHSVTWDGQSAPSGVYYYRLTAGNFTQNRKMLLLK